MSIYIGGAEEKPTALYMGSYYGLRELDSCLHTGVGEVLQYDQSEKEEMEDSSIVLYTPDWATVKAAATAELEKLPRKESCASEWLRDVVGHAERAEGRGDVFIQFCW